MRYLLGLVFVLAFSGTACACDIEVMAEQSIRDCTFKINSGKWTGREQGLNYYRRGVGYSRLNKFKLAIADQTQAIRLNPEHAQAYNERGIAYKRLRQYQLAIADYTEAIRLVPRYALAYSNRGNAYGHQKKYSLAIADYKEAIRHNSALYQPYNNLANLYYKTGQADKGAYYIHHAMRLVAGRTKFERAAVLDTRGHIFEALGRKAEAIQDYRAAYRLDPADPDYLKNLQRMGVKP